jgi:hypothetical protein
MNKGNTTAVFELFDSTLAEITPGLLGLWTTQPGASEVSFSLDSQPPADIPLWRSNFPADFNQVDKLLINSQERLKTFQQALNTLPDRIEHLITLVDSGAIDDIAFSVSATESPLAGPEQTLLTAVQTLKGIEPPQPVDVDFGIGQQLSGGWKQAYEQFQAFANRAIATTANVAWVETQIQGTTFARTIVNWTGDINTIWMNEVNAEQQLLHQRSLALALASRNELLQTLTTAIQLALKMSISLSLPGNAILALPAVWTFINQIVNQSREGKKDV